MRVKYCSVTGCPYGQFVIYADTDQERAILSYFISADRKLWRFWLHGISYKGDLPGPYAINFGYIRETQPKSFLKRFAKWLLERK